jgi:hypothetical protein
LPFFNGENPRIAAAETASSAALFPCRKNGESAAMRGAGADSPVTDFAMRRLEKRIAAETAISTAKVTKATAMTIKDTTAKCKRIDPILLIKLQKLCKLRWCNHFIPDSDAGRAMLATLLRFGLTDESAIESAPWCEGELATLKRRARRIPNKWRDSDIGREVGKLIDLTFKEWILAKLFMLRPVDASESEIEAWREKRRKESARNRQANRRDKLKRERETMQAKWQPTTQRQKAILEILIKNHLGPMWRHITSVPELMKEAKKLPAFAGVKNLRDAIHETLNQLEAKHVIRTHSFRPIRMVMLDIWHDAKSASEASDSGVGLPTPAFEQKSRKVNDLAENGGCHAPLRTFGSVTKEQTNVSPFPKLAA